MAEPLAFNEYQAIRRRRQRDEDDQAEEGAEAPAPAAGNADADEDEEDEGGSWSERAGLFAEMHEVQLLMAALIILDLAASSVELLSDCEGTWLSARLPSALLRLAKSFTGFTVFLFLFELMALVLAFGGRFFLHPGYAIDVVVVALCLRATPARGFYVFLFTRARPFRFRGHVRVG